MENEKTCLAEKYTFEKNELSSTLQDLNAHAQNLEKQKMELTAHLKGASCEINRMQTLLDESSTQTHVTSAANLKLTTNLQSEVKDGQDTMSELNSTVHSLQKDIQMLTNELEGQQKQKMELNSAMRTQMETYQEEMIRFKRVHAEEICRSDAEVHQVQNKFSEADESRRGMERRMKMLREEIEDLQHEKSVRGDELEKYKVKGVQTLGELSELTTTHAKLEEEHLFINAMHKKVSVELRDVMNIGTRLCVNVGVDETAFPQSLEIYMNTTMIELKHLQKSTKEMESVIESLTTGAKTHGDDMNRLSVQMQHSDKEYQVAKSDAAALVQTLHQLRSVEVVKEKNAQELETSLRKSIDELQKSSSVESLKLQRNYETQRSRVLALEDEKRELLQEVEQVNYDLTSRRHEKSQLQIMLTDAKEEHVDTKRKMDELVLQKDATEAKMADLTVSVSRLQDDWQHKYKSLQHEKDGVEQGRAELSRSLEKLTVEHDKHKTNVENEMKDLQNVQSEKDLLFEEKRNKLEEAAALVSELRQELTSTAKNNSSDHGRVMKDLEETQSQCLHLGQENTRLEVSLASNARALEQTGKELRKSREEVQTASESLHALDTQIITLTAEVAQKGTDVTLLTKSREASQVEMDRGTKDYNEMLRQFEVSRRDMRSQKSKFEEEIETLRHELEKTSHEASESAQVAEELQNKIGSVQSSSHGTINELMGELKTIEETLRLERIRNQKEVEKYKNQVSITETESQRRENANALLINTLRDETQNQSDLVQDVEQLNAKLQRQNDAKRSENEKMTKDGEEKSSKIAELNRNVNALKNSKKLHEEKITSLKQSVESKVKELQSCEDRFLANSEELKREKRELEQNLHRVTLDQDSKITRKSESEVRVDRENQTLKNTLERTLSHLSKNTDELSEVKDRLESTQEAANATIVNLRSRLESNEQEKKISIMEVQRQLDLERERRISAENERMEMTHVMRTTSGAAEDLNWDFAKITGDRSRCSSRNSTTSTISTGRSSVLRLEPLPPSAARRSLDDADGYDERLESVDPVRTSKVPIGVPSLEFSKINNGAVRRFETDIDRDSDLLDSTTRNQNEPHDEIMQYNEEIKIKKSKTKKKAVGSKKGFPKSGKKIRGSSAKRLPKINQS